MPCQLLVGNNPYKKRESLARERIVRIEERHLSFSPVVWMNEATDAEYGIVPKVVKQFATIPFKYERDYETR